MHKIGSWQLPSQTLLAPMAGISDLPFRQICRNMGAGLTTSEMVTSDASLWESPKSRSRLTFTKDDLPRSVQIAGNEPERMANAARLNQELGADIIDINMGCPAKKVCKKAAGSALLRDEHLVEDILTAVVSAVDIPVTLKIRTGWSQDHKNGITIAKIAENCGIQALAVHGRTRECRFKGTAEYDTIAEIVDQVNIPIWANGDIDSGTKAKQVLDHTGASGVMIGRAAQGNPWIFREINHFLKTGENLAPPTTNEIQITLLTHINLLHQFYGEARGVRIARKHFNWYMTQFPKNSYNNEFNQITTAQQQYECIQQLFECLPIREEHAA